MATKAEQAARELLAANSQRARRMAQEGGAQQTRKLLEAAQRDLEQRLKQSEGLRGPGKDSFTAVQQRATLAQVRAAVAGLNKGLRAHLVDQAGAQGVQGAEDTAGYLAAADRAFRGVGTQPLALDTARMLSAGGQGS